MQTSPMFVSRTFSPSPDETLLSWTPTRSPPPPLTTRTLHSISVTDRPGYLKEMESYSLCPSVPGLFHLVLSSRFIHVVVWARISFLFKGAHHSMVSVCCILFIPDHHRHLGCFPILAILNNTAMNVGVQILCDFFLTLNYKKF